MNAALRRRAAEGYARREAALRLARKWFFAVYVGFFAGLIWGAARWLACYLHFTKVQPGFMLEPFFTRSFVRSAAGDWSGYAAFIVFSVIASLLYTALLFRWRGPWPGILYGFGWWTVLFAIVGCPFFGLSRLFRGPDLTSLITEACIFLVWGVFIGYSTAFEFHDERQREPEAA